MLAERKPSEVNNGGSERSPGWARSVDEVGRRFQHEPTEEGRALARTSGYVGAIVGNAIFLFVVHHLRAWGVTFITPAIVDVFWAFDLSLGATIVANAIFLGYDARWFRRFAQIILSGLAFVATSTLYGVFPFEFGEQSFDDGARFALLLVMFAILIAIVVQVVVLIVGEIRRAIPD